MKTMRRLLSLAMLMILVPMILFGGGGQESEEDIVTIRYQQWWNSGVRAENLAWNIERFQELYPNIRVEPMAITNEEYWDRLTLDIASGTEGDVVALDTGAGLTGYYLQRSGGAFIDLREYVDGYTLHDGTVLTEDVLLIDTLERDGKLIALPYIAFYAPHTAYRKSHLEAAGIDPKELETWEGFRRAAEILTKDHDGDGTIDQYGFAHPTRAEVISRWWHMHWLWTAGGGIFPKEEPPYTADRLIFDSPENAYAIEYLKELLSVSAPPGNTDLQQLLNMFYGGSLSMIHAALWTVGNFESLMPEDFPEDVGFAPFPALERDGERRDPIYVAWGNPLAVSSVSEHPEEAFKFIAFLHSEEVQRRQTVTASPTNANVLPYYRENSPVRGEYVDLATEYELRIVPDLPQWGQFDQILQQAVNAALLDIRPVEDALRDAEQDMADLIR